MKRAFLGTFVAELGLVGLGVLTASVAARLLLPEGRGALAAVLFWPQLLAGIGLFSLNEAVTCHISGRVDRDRASAPSVVTLALSLAALATLAGYLLMPYLLGQTRNDLAPVAQTYLVAFIPFNFTALALLSMDLGRLSFRRYNTLRLLVPALYLIGLLGLWITDSVSVGGVAAVNCAATIITTLVRMMLEGRALIGWPSVEAVRDLLKLAGRFQPTALVAIVTAHADRFVVLALWDNTALGYYVVALTLAGSCFAIVTNAFQKVLFPQLARPGESLHRRTLFARGIRQATLSLVALSIPLMLVTPWLIEFLFGHAFRDAVPVAMAFVAAYPLISLKTILIQCLRALGDARSGFVAAILSLALFCALVWPAGQAMGLMGVATSLAVAEALGLLYLAWHLRRSQKLTLGDVWGVNLATIADVIACLLQQRPFFARGGTANHQRCREQATGLGGNGIPRVHVAMLGAQRHYAVPRLLARAGVLGRFYTDLYAGSWPGVSRVLTAVPKPLRPRWVQRFLGRLAPELPRSSVVAFGRLGLQYFFQRQRARDIPSLERVYAREAAAFGGSAVRHMRAWDGVRQGDALFAYSGGAVELLEYAKARGLSSILEQIIAPREVLKELLQEELRRWPGWQPGLHLERRGVMDFRELREWELADVIIASSNYVLDGLRGCGVPDSKCRLVPYGVPLDCFPPRRPRLVSSKLRVLFAGEVGLRKGAQYLLEALRVLGSRWIDARFAGIVALDATHLQPYKELATFLGPVPRARMSSVFQWADVFVLPSICEGSALVTYEALASGIPVIATPNAGAPLRDGVDGFLVPIRDIERLVAAIERFAGDAELLRWCSENALLGRERLGLSAYGERLVHVVREAAGSAFDCRDAHA